MVSRPTSRERRLGQNFLVDPNILDVIERLAAVNPEDVVLEIGAGPGALSRRLAAAARHLHAVEVDRGLEPRLHRALHGHANVTVHLADALELDLGALEPAPNLIVANLPYRIAATAILRTIEELPCVVRWVVMVQREVGERFAASPGSPAYGTPSVLAQLATTVKVLRPVSRNVFRPAPNVDSVLLGLERHGVAAPVAMRSLVRDAFRHRRKALASSLALAPGAPPGMRERARAALRELGHPEDERAERLSAMEFRRLSELLGPSS
jgi:16S rRNA (adenine1518-N6/adenine1519-N6)-dimethyltransferase